MLVKTKKILRTYRFWPSTEKWTNVHKIVHEKVGTENDGRLYVPFRSVNISATKDDIAKKILDLVSLDPRHNFRRFAANSDGIYFS